eukprot:5499361-Pleurochrysis_carterae.AAC.1
MITISTLSRAQHLLINCRRAPFICNRHSRARFAVLQSHCMHTCGALALCAPQALGTLLAMAAPAR